MTKAEKPTTSFPYLLGDPGKKPTVLAVAMPKVNKSTAMLAAKEAFVDSLVGSRRTLIHEQPK